MKGFAASVAVILMTVTLFCANAFAVNVSSYDAFQAALLAGNNAEITPSDIVKTGTNSTTISIPSSLTITGNGRVIEINRIGNMMTLSNPNITVNMSSFIVRQGFSAGNGGAINVTGSNAIGNISGNSTFELNFSSGFGGAISATNNAAFTFTGSTNFSGNSSASGGAVSLTGGASANFAGTVLSASGNKSNSGNGGFLYADSSGIITFGSATFTGNAALLGSITGIGGAIYANRVSNINFTGDVSFINNSAFAAGAMGISSGTVATFSGSNTLFQGNHASAGVAALMVRDGSTVIFQGENTVFRSNYMTNNVYGTGAMDVAYNATADFSGTNLLAQANNAGNGGRGGFLWINASNIIFGNVTIGGAATGNGNVAHYGGGIYAEISTTMTFSGADTLFQGNRAIVDGGALYVSTNTTVSFTGSSTSFRNNTAGNKGGALFLTNNSNISFTGASNNFSGNTAALGGAVSVEGGSTLQINNGNFTGNQASMMGGAIYLRGGSSTQLATLRSNTTSAGAGRTIFASNGAQGVPNSMYLDDYSSAYFTAAAGTTIEVFDGISGRNSANTYFGFTGAGDFNLYGTFDTLDLNSSGRFNLMSGSHMNAATVNNMLGARFNMENDINDTAYMRTLNNFGAIALDIIPNSNDKIIVSGNLALNAGSVLEVKADSLTDNNFRKRIYKLINYDTYSGSFGAPVIVAPVQPVSWDIAYGTAYDNWVTLAMLGNLSATEFSQKELDTFNQKEAAKALDKISAGVTNYSDWDLALADIEAYDNDGLKKILSHLAGYFLPNVIRNAAADSPNNEIYDRIKNHCVEGHLISNGLWIQAKGGVETFYENDNSIGDYKDTSAGIMAGYDRFMADKNLMLGIYARFNSDSIEQGRNKADGTKTGIGVYGGYIKEGWELKALTLGSFDSFDTKRYIPYTNATAKAEIKTMTFSFDLEGALKFDMTLNTKFRPYAGLELANASYGGFEETGAGIYNLDVKSGNYVRSAARVGTGVQYEESIWSFYANLEGKYLLSGTEPEIENTFKDTDALFKTRGAKEGALEVGGGVGGAVRLTNELKLFVNGSIYGADKYQNIYGNVGLRYTFCNTLSTKKSAPAPEPVYTYTEPAPVQPEPVMRRSEDIDMLDESVVEEQKAEAMKRREKPVLKSYSLNMASFDVNKSDLKPAAKKDIAREAEEIKQFDYKRIIIEGHTDSTGSDELNKNLSKARAKAVYDEFVSHGMPEEKMWYIGFGPTMPRDTNTTKEGKANNRRVEIFVE